jgi:hypothetical protein
MSVYKGDPTITYPVGEVETLTWNRGSGEAWQFFEKGPFGYVYDRLYELRTEFDSIHIRRIQGAMFSIEAARGGDDYTEIYEVNGSTLTQAVLQNLVMRQQFLDAGVAEADYSAMVSKIAMEVSKYKALQQDYATMTGAVSTIGGNRQIAFDLMDRIDRYGDQSLQAQYALTHTTCVSERFFELNGLSFNAVYDNTLRIHTETQLRAAEAVPPDFKLPQSILDPNVSAEWLKQPVTCRFTNNKRELTTTYLFADHWLRLDYKEAQ